jgi:hypothetical protein
MARRQKALTGLKHNPVCNSFMDCLISFSRMCEKIDVELPV